MSTQAHLATLERRHQALDREISGAQAHNQWDDLEIAELKRRKLLVKDEIEQLRYGLSAPAPEVALSAKIRKRAAMRAARLKSSSWYETATRSISIVK